MAKKCKTADLEGKMNFEAENDAHRAQLTAATYALKRSFQIGVLSMIQILVANVILCFTAH